MRSRTRSLRRIALIGLVVCVVGCGFLNLTRPGHRARLRLHAAQWQMLHPARYRYTLKQENMAVGLAEGPVPSTIIEVQNNRVVRATDGQTGRSLPLSRLGDSALIEQLFHTIEVALDRGVDFMTVDYHLLVGYPRYIYIDGAGQVYDDERTFSIEQFETLR
jgi:hypothetical protein